MPNNEFGKFNKQKVFCVDEKKEKALMDIIDIIPNDIRENVFLLREAYRNGDIVAPYQEEIESDIKVFLFKKELSVENAYIISEANDVYGIWENCVND